MADRACMQCSLTELGACVPPACEAEYLELACCIESGRRDCASDAFYGCVYDGPDAVEFITCIEADDPCTT
jgi:hypothetical protein